MNAILSSEPYEILQAYDGKTALEQINQSKIDIVLLDIMMPGMDGYEVTSKLKSDPQTRHIPIILVSALNSRENKLRGLELGADEFLTKPVNKIEILSRIKSMLRLRQYQEQLNARLKSEETLTMPTFERNNVSQRPSAGQKVLLVEDDEKDIKLFETITYGQPYSFMVAKCGEEAIRLAQQEKIDLIILDILLPGINGYQVCEQLKGSEKTRNIQIVMISCLSDLESKIKGVEQGVDDFLVKPIDSRQIKSRINALLKKKLYLDQLHYHNEKALDLAIIDGLTGLYNQSYFKRYLELEIQRSVQQGYQVALIMTDLDDFKKINDTFGHPTGDAVLQEFTRIIKANIREMDLPARYGGEEFVVVVPYADGQIASEIAEKVRMAICNHGFTNEIPCSWGKITASFGVASCPSDATNVDGLIEKADFMLYRAKRAGKNRVCTFE
jgi:two-component system cell cycle response regulator